MSSSTSYSMTPSKPPSYRVTTRHGVSGVQTLDLSGVLGTTGCSLFNGTLQRLSADPSSGWTQVDEAYRMEVRENLPAGVASMQVKVQLAAGFAEVSHQCTYQKTEVQSGRAAGALPAGLVESVRKQVNRSINGVLMHTVANEIRQKVENKMKATNKQQIQQSLHVHLRNANQIQLLTRMRMGVGR